MARTLLYIMLVTSVAMTRATVITLDKAMFQEACTNMADLMFLIDGSDSMFLQDFNEEKAFIRGLMSGLYFNRVDGMMAGIIAYSSELQVIGLMDSKDDLNTNLENIFHEREGTFTSLAIQRGIAILERDGRPNIPRIMLVVTDGRSKNPAATAGESALARSRGIKMIAVGVGFKVDVDELGSIASPGLMITVPNFVSLRSMTLSIAREVCPGICDECTFVDGVGYNRHETLCYHYYQCYYNGVSLVPVLRICPPSEFWDQELLSCTRAASVNCANDPCQSATTSTVSFVGNCRAYWSCNGNLTNRAWCCDTNQQGFNGINGCQINSACMDNCPYSFTWEDNAVCSKKPDPSSQIHYILIVQPGWELSLPCPPGTAFNIVTCVCDIRVSAEGYRACRAYIHFPFDTDLEADLSRITVWNDGNVVVDRDPALNAIGGGAAKFNGLNRLVLWVYSNAYYGNRFTIRFRYMELPSAQSYEPLISNSECESPCSVHVGVNRTTASTRAAVQTENRDEVALAQRNGGTRWKQVEFQYNEGVFRLTVDGIAVTVSTAGNIQPKGPLSIGGACIRDTPGFTGWIDELYIFKCIPQ